MKVYIGADHRGFYLKEKIKKWLGEWKYEFEDLGAYEFNPKDDYTYFAQRVGSIVGPSSYSKRQDNGILLCGSGVGVDVAVNKFDGVRGSIGKSPEQIKAGRRDDDMNVLVIAADYTPDEEAKRMIRVFLKTEFAAKRRFKRRLEDIKKIEANN